MADGSDHRTPSYTGAVLLHWAYREWNTWDGICLLRTGRSFEELNPRQICNFVYAAITDNKNKVEVADIDLQLAPPEEKERMLAKKNQLAQAQLGGFGIAPPPRQRRMG